MPEIGVVHLVRRANGIAPLERFLQSYRSHRAGAEHELLLLFKGFGGERPGAEYRAALDGLPHRVLMVADRGFDLEPYLKAAAHFEHRYFCFFNSFSRLLAPDWLAMLREATSAGAGLAGATASCESLAALRAPKGWVTRLFFPPFPNAHLRTNAFIATRDVLSRITLRPLLFKFLALAAESGKDGLTAQARRAGHRARLVDRHGAVFTEERWHLANTFRQSRQENLLVADNQTDTYELADAGTRGRLSRLAWGACARPE